MSTLAEIEEAADTLPPEQQERLLAHIAARLNRAITQHAPPDILGVGKVPERHAPEPDFVARARRIWGEKPPGAPLSELVSESRD